MRVAALYRMSRFLDSENVKTMYAAFVRSIMEYGAVQWMGAAKTHLEKLDRVQATAMRIGGFEVGPLLARRETTLFSFSSTALKEEE